MATPPDRRITAMARSGESFSLGACAGFPEPILDLVAGELDCLDDDVRVHTRVAARRRRPAVRLGRREALRERAPHQQAG